MKESFCLQRRHNGADVFFSADGDNIVIYATKCGMEFYVATLVDAAGPCPLLKMCGPIGVPLVRFILDVLEYELGVYFPEREEV